MEEIAAEDERQTTTERRRDLLINIAAVGETVLMTAPAVALYTSMHISSRNYMKAGKDIILDKNHVLEGGGQWRNLGVRHAGDVYQEHQTFFRKAIDDCDTLLIECIEGEDFFEPLKNYALTKQKRVVMIDDIRKNLLVCSGFIFPIVMGSVLAIEHMIYTEDCKNKDEQLRISYTRRNILRAISAGALGLQWLSGVHHISQFSEDDTSAYNDYLARGRSASMFSAAQSVMQEESTKNHLVLTGAAHAQVFEEYLEHPEHVQIDLQQYAVHRAIFGEGSQEVTK